MSFTFSGKINDILQLGTYTKKIECLRVSFIFLVMVGKYFLENLEIKKIELVHNEPLYYGHNLNFITNLITMLLT